MSSTPNNPDETADAKSQSSAKLRALLDGVELTPEQTSDDVAPPTNRDREMLEDVPTTSRLGNKKLGKQTRS
jgi:hypothetical protein